MQRTQVIIVRHGETEWNIAGIRQGHLDSELTEKGIAQAKALAQRLAREKFCGALQQRSRAGPCKRQRRSPTLTGHEIVTDARLRERQLRNFSGTQWRRNYREVSRRAASVIARWDRIT